MQQRIAHIGLGSALRMAGLIGLVVCFLPSIVLAGVLVNIVQRVQGLFAQLSSVTIAIPAQQVGPLRIELPPLQLDLVERVGLAPAGRTFDSLASSPLGLGLTLTLGLLLLGTALLFAGVAVAVVAYNLLAPRMGGVEVRMAGSDYRL